MDIEKEINNLKDRVDKLENKDIKTDFFLDERASENDIVGKSYRFHQSAVNEFNNLIRKKSLKIYTVQDLLSQALWEFCEKYKDLE